MATAARSLDAWSPVVGPAPVARPGTGRRLAATAASVALLCLGAAALTAAGRAPAAAKVGSRTAIARARPAPAPDAFATASARAAVELSVKFAAGDSLGKLLVRAGTAKDDADHVAALLADAGIMMRPGAAMVLALGDRNAGGRSLQALSLRPNLGLQVKVARSAGGDFALSSQAAEVDATPLRFRGRAGVTLFWSLRSAGVPADAARDYLDAVTARVPLDRVAPDDSFDLIIDHRRTASGESESGPLLYAGLNRARGGDVQLVRWNVGGSAGWYDPRIRQSAPQGLLRPVAGPTTSAFGLRVHPILLIARFHRGVDYRAGWGEPIRAAADGVVVGAGWAGGYGRQVRLVHAGGLATSYAHMSQIAVTPGAMVRRGQVIGYVGSSGFSTGPHLHFEVHRDGRLLNPLDLQQSTAPAITVADSSALKIRLGQLLAI